VRGRRRPLFSDRRRFVDTRCAAALHREHAESPRGGSSKWLAASYAHEDLESLRDVNKSLLDQIDEFFTSYNKMRGKKFKIKKRAGPKQALAILKDGIKAYKKSKKR